MSIKSTIIVSTLLLNTVICGLLSTTCIAQQIQLGAGTHYGSASVIINVDSQGKITYVIDPSKPVFLYPNSPTNPNPNPNPNPEPEPSNPFEKTVSDITKIVINQGGTKTTAAAISSVYSLVSEGVGNGSITIDKAFSAVSSATSLVLTSQADGNKWQTWRDEVGKSLVVLQQDGSLKTKEDYTKVLKEISNGINSAIGVNSETLNQLINGNNRVENRLFENIDIQKLIELVKLVMELLKLFGLSRE